jgi:hypothetical protein
MFATSSSTPHGNANRTATRSATANALKRQLLDGRPELLALPIQAPPAQALFALPGRRSVCPAITVLRDVNSLTQVGTKTPSPQGYEPKLSDTETLIVVGIKP